ncbi:MAG: PHP domain-containing protein [Erysipelotrichaceae bacterium]
MVYADLHCHTNYSDGVHSLEEVFKFQSEKNTKVVAITDHDTVFHYDEIKKTAAQFGIRTINGVEMSCYDNDVFKKVHVVGLFLNDQPANVKALCDQTLLARDNYHRKLIEELNQKGLEITYQQAKQFSPHNIVFKMHLFMAIVKKYPEYMNMAKYRELFAGKTTKEVDKQMGYIDVKAGINAIHQDGGIAILAHPCEYDNYAEIDKYVSYGLDGIEISHPLMQEKDYQLVKQYLEKHHLLSSGGSDFHNMAMQSDFIGNYGLSQEQFEAIENRQYYNNK